MSNTNAKIQKLLQELKAECPECGRWLSKDEMVKTMDAGTVCRKCADGLDWSFEGFWNGTASWTW